MHCPIAFAIRHKVCASYSSPRREKHDSRRRPGSRRRRTPSGHAPAPPTAAACAARPDRNDSTMPTSPGSSRPKGARPPLPVREQLPRLADDQRRRQDHGEGEAEFLSEPARQTTHQADGDRRPGAREAAKRQTKGLHQPDPHRPDRRQLLAGARPVKAARSEDDQTRPSSKAAADQRQAFEQLSRPRLEDAPRRRFQHDPRSIRYFNPSPRTPVTAVARTIIRKRLPHCLGKPASGRGPFSSATRSKRWRRTSCRCAA